MPLRKVRKSARLRFMSPAEMVTSATWTADLLDSSVFMKVNDGQRRLYITTPHAYLQKSDGGWTWKDRHVEVAVVCCPIPITSFATALRRYELNGHRQTMSVIS